jgi:hypothetical protein
LIPRVWACKWLISGVWRRFKVGIQGFGAGKRLVSRGGAGIKLVSWVWAGKRLVSSGGAGIKLVSRGLVRVKGW